MAGMEEDQAEMLLLFNLLPRELQLQVTKKLAEIIQECLTKQCHLQMSYADYPSEELRH